MSDQVSAFQSWLTQATALPCFVEGDVPAGQAMPYVTHRMQIGAFGDQGSIEVDVWCPPGAAAKADGYALSLRAALGMRGDIVECDGGAVWLTRGTPFAQPVPDDRAERRYCNIDIDYLTSD